MRFAAVLGPLVVLLALTGCGGGGLTSPTGDLASGKERFVQSCGSCHTLADAGTKGTIGPNLDDAFAGSRAQGFDEETFVQVVREQIAFPGVDSPMQPDLVTGKDADDVSAYVARYAGNTGLPPSQPVPGQGGTGQTGGAETGGGGQTGGAGQTGGGGAGAGGEAIFSQNCASCHTLAAAGASGTVGPNLDDLKPPKDTVVTQVENGGGVMPAFKDQLSKEQIDAVAQFVADNAGR